MRFSWHAVCLGAAALALVAGTSTADAAFEIKISHAANTKHPIHRALEEFKELAEERSNNELSVTIFHSGQLAGQREGVEGLQLGTIEIVAIPSGVAAGFDPAFTLFDIPFQFDDIEHARRVIDAVADEYIFADLDRSGLVGLAIWEQGYRNLGTVARPVHAVADVKDLKIRTMEAPLHVAAWRALGANPTPMGWAQVFPSLQQGVVDGVEIPSYLFTQTGVHEAIKHVILTHHIYDSVIVLGSKRRFDSMPEDLRQIVIDTMRELTPAQRAMNQADVEEAERELPALGVEVTVLTPEQMAEFQTVSQPSVLAEVREKLGDSRVDAWLQAIADHR
jgi:tripartite ATP-independent transporter DctP family solute receptor